MKNITCQSLKHRSMWSIAPQQSVFAFAGTINPSIRSYNDEGLPRSFIEGVGSK
jgi:hypothetical protein